MSEFCRVDCRVTAVTPVSIAVNRRNHTPKTKRANTYTPLIGCALFLLIVLSKKLHKKTTRDSMNSSKRNCKYIFNDLLFQSPSSQSRSMATLYISSFALIV